MPRTQESAADREKRLRRERGGVVDLGDPRGNVEMGPMTVETNRRPAGAREVSREEFERIQRGERPVVDGLDIEIGDAEIEAEDPDIARFNARPSGARMPSSANERTRAALSAEIPPEWLRRPDTAPLAEADEGSSSRAQRHNRALRRRAAYDRSLTDGLVMDSDNLDALQAGTIQGVTLGFADELEGVARHGLERQRRGFGGTERETYSGARDERRADNERLQAQSPGFYGGGEVLGSALPALAMPGANARTALGRVGQATGYGGLMGGVQGLGHSQGDVGRQALDTAVGGGIGAGFGLAGQTLAEGATAARGWYNSTPPGTRSRVMGDAPEGTPRAGADFTPEQRARIDADPQLDRMRSDRDAVERAAAESRVRTAHPNMTAADVAEIERSHPGGMRGLARDMDASGISPRRSSPSSGDVRYRAEVAQRPVVDIEPPPLMPDEALPTTARTGQFPDDEHVRMAPASGETPQPRDWRQDIPDDPHDSAPFDPNDTLEQQMRREFAREGRNTGASTQAGTNPRVRAGRPERPIEFAEGMRAGDRVGRTRPESLIDEGDAVIASRAPTEPQRPAVDLGDEPIDFAMDPEPRSGALDDAHAARRQANIRAAERRARRGGYSESTQDERTWPVRPGDVEDITPADPTAQPPPLPRRPAPQVDLGRWDAPQAATPPALPQAPQPRTPMQRTGDAVRELTRRGEQEMAARGGSTDQRGVSRRGFEDYVVRNWLRGRGSGVSATVAETHADAIAGEIVRRLNANPSTITSGRVLAEAMRRSPRAFGAALIAEMRRPEVASVAGPVVQSASHPDGSPNWGIVQGMRYAGDQPTEQTDPGAPDWSLVPGVRYADDVEEQDR